MYYIIEIVVKMNLKLGNSLMYVISNMKLNLLTIDMMDLLPILKAGYATENSIHKILYIYIITMKLYNKDDTFHCDQVFGNAFNGIIPSDFISINKDRLTTISGLRSQIIPYMLNTLQTININSNNVTMNNINFAHIKLLWKYNSYTENDDINLKPYFDNYYKCMIHEDRLINEIAILFSDNRMLEKRPDIFKLIIDNNLISLFSKLSSVGKLCYLMNNHKYLLLAIHKENVEIVKLLISKAEIDPRRNNCEAYRFSINKYNEKSVAISELIYHAIIAKNNNDDKIVDSYLTF